MKQTSRSLDFLGFPNYTISEDGTLTNLKGRVLKPTPHVKGYLRYTLQNQGRKYNTLGHRLVALAFIPNPNNYETVDHIDSNPANNHVSNLRWLPREENAKDAWDKGNHDEKKKQVLQLSLDGEVVNTFSSIQEAADHVDIDRSCISRACSKGSKSRGFFWKTV